HLHPFETRESIGGVDTTLKFEFGHHCFTDEKGRGVLVRHQGEERYFCMARYRDSFGLVTWAQDGISDGYAVHYRNRKGKDQYFHKRFDDYAIFFSVRRPADRPNYLKIRVISAYELNAWGQAPKGKLFRISY